MSRREDRETSFSLLYEYLFYSGMPADDFTAERESFNEAPYSEFVRESFLGTVSALPEIDRHISSYSKGWKLSRLSKVTLSILRLAVYELIFTDTPPKVVINEAVELAKKYDEEKSTGFINGILNNLARDEKKIVTGGTAGKQDDE